MKIFISVASEREFRATKRAPMVREKREPVTRVIPPERQKQILIKSVTRALERKYFFELKARIEAYNLERTERNGEKLTAADRKARNKKIAEYTQQAKEMTAAYTSALADVKKSGLKVAKSELPNEKDQKSLAEANFKLFKTKADALDVKKAKHAAKSAPKAEPKTKTPSTFSIVKLNGDNMYDVKKDRKRVATVKTTQIKTTLRKLTDAGLNVTQIKKVFKLLGMEFPK